MILWSKTVDFLHHLEKLLGVSLRLLLERFPSRRSAVAEQFVGGEWLGHSRIDLSKWGWLLVERRSAQARRASCLGQLQRGWFACWPWELERRRALLLLEEKALMGWQWRHAGAHLYRGFNLQQGSRSIHKRSHTNSEPVASRWGWPTPHVRVSGWFFSWWFLTPI